MSPVPVEIICYHCEQSVEKLLKGVLVKNNTEPPKTHDLLYLCKLCCSIDSHFTKYVDACISLTPYGVQFRYPTDMELEIKDACEALKQAEMLFASITHTLKMSEPDIDGPDLSL